MKRKQFIKQTLMATVALNMPWTKLSAQSAETCENKYEAKKEMSNDVKLMFEIVICNEAITGFSYSSAAKKIVHFKAWKATAAPPAKALQYGADYKIVSVKQSKSSESEYIVDIEFLQENKAEFKLPKDINIKKMSLKCSQEDDEHTISMPDKKGNEFVLLKEDTESGSSGYGDGCYLTTACVQMMGKADDCDELTRLRLFRDNVLKSTNEGRMLVEEYYTIAPQIVDAINHRSDKRVVYEAIYTQMILPTLHEIEAQHAEKAIEIYTSYTLQLKKEYLHAEHV